MLAVHYDVDVRTVLCALDQHCSYHDMEHEWKVLAMAQPAVHAQFALVQSSWLRFVRKMLLPSIISATKYHRLRGNGNELLSAVKFETSVIQHCFDELDLQRNGRITWPRFRSIMSIISTLKKSPPEFCSRSSPLVSDCKGGENSGGSGDTIKHIELASYLPQWRLTACSSSKGDGKIHLIDVTGVTRTVLQDGKQKGLITGIFLVSLPRFVKQSTVEKAGGTSSSSSAVKVNENDTTNNNNNNNNNSPINREKSNLGAEQQQLDESVASFGESSNIEQQLDQEQQTQNKMSEEDLLLKQEIEAELSGNKTSSSSSSGNNSNKNKKSDSSSQDFLSSSFPQLVTSATDGSIIVWDLNRNGILDSLKHINVERPVIKLDFDTSTSLFFALLDGGSLVSVDWVVEGKDHVLKTNTYRNMLEPIGPHLKAPSCLAVIDARSQVATSGDDAVIALWSSSSLVCLCRVATASGSSIFMQNSFFAPMIFSQDNNNNSNTAESLLSASAISSSQKKNEKKSSSHSSSSYSQGIRSLTVSKQLGRIFAMHASKSISCWNIDSMVLEAKDSVGVLKSGHESPIVGVFCDELGEYVVSVDEASTVCVWSSRSLILLEKSESPVTKWDKKSLASTVISCACYDCTTRELIVVANSRMRRFSGIPSGLCAPRSDAPFQDIRTSDVIAKQLLGRKARLVAIDDASSLLVFVAPWDVAFFSLLDGKLVAHCSTKDIFGASVGAEGVVHAFLSHLPPSRRLASDVAASFLSLSDAAGRVIGCVPASVVQAETPEDRLNCFRRILLNTAGPVKVKIEPSFPHPSNPNLVIPSLFGVFLLAFRGCMLALSHSSIMTCVLRRENHKSIAQQVEGTSSSSSTKNKNNSNNNNMSTGEGEEGRYLILEPVAFTALHQNKPLGHPPMQLHHVNYNSQTRFMSLCHRNCSEVVVLQWNKNSVTPNSTDLVVKEAKLLNSSATNIFSPTSPENIINNNELIFPTSSIESDQHALLFVIYGRDKLVVYAMARNIHPVFEVSSLTSLFAATSYSNEISNSSFGAVHHQRGGAQNSNSNSYNTGGGSSGQQQLNSSVNFFNATGASFGDNPFELIQTAKLVGWKMSMMNAAGLGKHLVLIPEFDSGDTGSLHNSIRNRRSGGSSMKNRGGKTSSPPTHNLLTQQSTSSFKLSPSSSNVYGGGGQHHQKTSNDDHEEGGDTNKLSKSTTSFLQQEAMKNQVMNEISAAVFAKLTSHEDAAEVFLLPVNWFLDSFVTAKQNAGAKSGKDPVVPGTCLIFKNSLADHFDGLALPCELHLPRRESFVFPATIGEGGLPVCIKIYHQISQHNSVLNLYRKMNARAKKCVVNVIHHWDVSVDALPRQTPLPDELDPRFLTTAIASGGVDDNINEEHHHHHDSDQHHHAEQHNNSARHEHNKNENVSFASKKRIEKAISDPPPLRAIVTELGSHRFRDAFHYSMGERVQILLQIVDNLAELAANGYTCIDISPNSIVQSSTDSRWKLSSLHALRKLPQFGSQVVTDYNAVTDSQIMYSWYCDPDFASQFMKKTPPYGPSALWQVGCLAYELCMQQAAFQLDVPPHGFFDLKDIMDGLSKILPATVRELMANARKKILAGGSEFPKKEQGYANLILDFSTLCLLPDCSQHGNFGYVSKQLRLLVEQASAEHHREEVIRRCDREAVGEHLISKGERLSETFLSTVGSQMLKMNALDDIPWILPEFGRSFPSADRIVSVACGQNVLIVIAFDRAEFPIEQFGISNMNMPSSGNFGNNKSMGSFSNSYSFPPASRTLPPSLAASGNNPSAGGNDLLLCREASFNASASSACFENQLNCSACSTTPRTGTMALITIDISGSSNVSSSSMKNNNDISASSATMNNASSSSPGGNNSPSSGRGGVGAARAGRITKNHFLFCGMAPAPPFGNYSPYSYKAGKWILPSRLLGASNRMTVAAPAGAGVAAQWFAKEFGSVSNAPTPFADSFAIALLPPDIGDLGSSPSPGDECAFSKLQTSCLERAIIGNWESFTTGEIKALYPLPSSSEHITSSSLSKDKNSSAAKSERAIMQAWESNLARRAPFFACAIEAVHQTDTASRTATRMSRALETVQNSKRTLLDAIELAHRSESRRVEKVKRKIKHGSEMRPWRNAMKKEEDVEDKSNNNKK